MVEQVNFNEAFDIANEHHKKKNYILAINIYKQLLNVDPNNKIILNALGISLLENKTYTEAINCFTKIIKIYPTFIDAQYNLGITFKELKKFKMAIVCFEKVIKIDQNHFNSINNIAQLFHKIKKYKKAIISYKKIIKINPTYIHAYNNLGKIFSDLKEYSNAINYYKQSVEIDPNYLVSHYNMGVVFYEINDYQNAINCYEKTLKIDPNFVLALFNLGMVSKKKNNFQKAQKYFEKAISIQPNYANAYNALGLLFMELKEFSNSKEYFLKAIKIDSSFLDAYINLALVYEKLNEPLRAINSINMAIEINPNYVNPHYMKGRLLFESKEFLDSLTHFYKALEIDHNHILSLNYLIQTIKLSSLINLNIDNITNFRKYYLLLFKNLTISHSEISYNVILFLLETGNYKQIKNIFNSSSLLLNNKIIQEFLKDELLHLILQKSLIESPFFEKLFMKLRLEMLTSLENSNKDFLTEYSDFIISLAEQCWLNEYIFTQSEEETNKINDLKNKIENNNLVNELEIAMLACYIPLNNSKIISDNLLNYKSKNTLFNDLLNVQIREPLKEIELSKSIRSLDKITDTVSIKVRDQYEEHPYPRWRYANKLIPKSFIEWINAEVKPNIIEYNDNILKPNILIAGCGTGNHTVMCTRYENADILAVDLSLASLAYSQRKTNELGLNNIKYLHADILQLKKLDKKFDIIECAGTLHHMKDPIAGLKTLLDILEPHGFLKIGLYSETARHHIVKAREFIKDKNFKNTVEDIKACRQLLLNEQDDQLLKKITDSSDFYSVSSIRDLIFHVQEHRFTLPQISKILKDLNLEFLGFIYPNPFMKEKYSKLFPNDKKKISLDNWHEYELRNPDTFANMYQFWVRKV